MGYHSNLEIFEYISGVAWRRTVGRGHKKEKVVLKVRSGGPPPESFFFRNRYELWQF